MTGGVLYPLNTLQTIYPDIYHAHKTKYEGREEMMGFIIPRLNCLWNDVLHFSAVHPKEVKDAIAQAGGRSDYTLSCYEIDSNQLELDKVVVYLYSTPNINLNMTTESEFVSFDPKDIEKYSHLPKETIEYYAESYRNKRKPLPFHRVPHILYKGSVDIKNCPIIEV